MRCWQRLRLPDAGWRLQLPHGLQRCVRGAGLFAGVAGLILWLFVGATALQAAEPVLSFQNGEQKALYEKLVTEYRCLKCQNQNLADSHADLAGDLRRQVYDQVIAGKGKAEIDDYLLSRYGEFVLYRPRFQMSTWLLWIGPFALLALSLFYGYRISSGKTRAGALKPTPDAMAQARRILQDSTDR